MTSVQLRVKPTTTSKPYSIITMMCAGRAQGCPRCVQKHETTSKMQNTLHYEADASLLDSATLLPTAILDELLGHYLSIVVEIKPEMNGWAWELCATCFESSPFKQRWGLYTGLKRHTSQLKKFKWKISSNCYVVALCYERWCTSKLSPISYLALKPSWKPQVLAASR